MSTKPERDAAFGRPGIEPRWTRSAKDAVGTAATSASLIWFTTSAGVLNEVYYPTIDRPQIRDLVLLITDGQSFFHDERRHLTTATEYIEDHALAVRITNSDPEERYRLLKEIVCDPREACVLMRVSLEASPELARRLRLFALLAPHLEGGGADNSAQTADMAGRTLLMAHKGNTWLALGADVPFVRRSCGFVGRSDGWTDLAGDFRLDWRFTRAEAGNVALVGEVDTRQRNSFTLGLAFGNGSHQAVSTLFQSLGIPFSEHRDRFLEEWKRACQGVEPLEDAAGDGGRLYRRSHSIILAHEDKTYPGALIASLSIPWGEAKGDEDLGGYHLVWTRDLCMGALALLASGSHETARRALIYLAVTQNPDGGFYQNFWVDGRPYGRGVQLDEAAMPIVLAWRLHEAGALEGFDPYPAVLAAAGYLIRNGPATPQERWEEASGYSPSTLASCIAALVCAALFARDRGDEDTARFILEYADFLEERVEAWTVTTRGELLPDVPRHYIRICPVDPSNPRPDEDPNRGDLWITNLPSGEPSVFPARNVVDAGFLELVRYGIRRAGDPLMEDSLRVVDAVLKVDTPGGPAWRRYNHDGYGQGPGGEPFLGAGRGRAWPLLTGERGHYELAAGRSPLPYIHAMEWFANGAGMLPEQIWDERQSRPDRGLFFGRPTGSAMPLMWAHAEYVRLLRSASDGVPFDRIEEVADRYQSARARSSPARGASEAPGARHVGEIWKLARQPRSAPAGMPLRVLADAPFRLRWTRDEWATMSDVEATPTRLGVYYTDLEIPAEQTAPIRFTFRWSERWEGADFAVGVAAPSSSTGAVPASILGSWSPSPPRAERKLPSRKRS